MVTDMPPDATENEFPLATVIGAPVHVPNSHRVGPPVSQISIPLIVHDEPDPFVHDNVVVFELASADAAANEHAVPPAVYPVPVISVMFTEAVGLLLPSRTFMPVTEAVDVCLSTAFRIALP